MLVIPAFDLMDGQITRLEQGDFNRSTRFDGDIFDRIVELETEGIDTIHLIDLDAAKGKPSNVWELAKRVSKQTQIKLQIGGGIRSLGRAFGLLELGHDVIVTSLIFDNPTEFSKLIEKCPGQVICAVDVKKDESGVFTIRAGGWLKDTRVELFGWLDKNSNRVQRILVTDISRDGMDLGPNFELYQDLQKFYPQIQLTASGGVGTIDHLQRLCEMGVDRCVVGKSFLRGDLQVQDFKRFLDCCPKLKS